MKRFRLAAAIVAMLAGSLLLAPILARRSVLRVTARPREGLVFRGSQNLAVSGRPVRILSFLAYHGRPDSVPEQKLGLYHVLVVAAADSLTPRSYDSEAFRYLDSPRTTTVSWWAWSGVHGGQGAVRALTSRYDPHRQQVRIGAADYPLSRGNLFVVRYDGAGRQSVRQLPRTLSDADPGNTLYAYRALLSAVDRDLLTPAPKPCPPPRAHAATPPRGAGQPVTSE